MVHNKKSLLAAIFIAAITFSVFSQENNLNSSSDNTTAVETSVSNGTGDYENSTTYFNNSSDTASNSNNYKAPSTLWTIVKTLFFLILVCVAIYFVMRFFKKKSSIAQSDDDFLRRVSTLILSPGKSVEIVTLLDKGYILGVTDGNISLISEIDDKELVSALNVNFDKKQNTTKPMNFSDVLDMFMAKPKTNSAAQTKISPSSIFSDIGTSFKAKFSKGESDTPETKE